MHNINGLVITGVILLISMAIVGWWEWRDRVDRRKVAEAIKNGTLWGPAAQRHWRDSHGRFTNEPRRIDRW
jgi:hypothetical protein